MLVSKKKILVAEDDDSMRRFIEVILRKANYEVLTAEDGLQAIQITLETKVDAVVTDAIMPNMSGYDVCRMLRGDAEKQDIPLIILSGLVQEISGNSDKHIADVFLLKDPNLQKNLLSELQKLFEVVSAQ